MPSLAICDDDPRQLHTIGKLIHTYFHTRSDSSWNVASFLSGDALLAQSHARNGFDLYLLDILMPGLNGIETGRQLRETGDGGEIIYLTSSNDFASESYDVRAFFYLLKPVDKQRLFQVLDRALEQ